MNKENALYVVIGLLLGMIIGFTFANSANRADGMQSLPAAATAGAIAPSGDLPPGHPDVNAQQAQAAMPAIQTAIDKAKQNPTDFESQIKVAELYNEIKKYNEAIEYLLIANKLKPDHYETIVNLGNANFDGKKYDEAEKWYTAALAKKSNDVNVRTDLGLTFVFREKPNFDLAIQEFNRSLQIEPNHVQTLQNLVFAYTGKGDAAKAKETLSKLESADPTNIAITKLRTEIDKIPVK